MKIGDKIPDFLGFDASGNEVKLSNYPDKKIILYFYPKDDTSGCTAQACSLQKNIQLLSENGYQIIGVSVDSAISHQKFADKYNLSFPLIADTDHRLVEEMGVWGEKSMYGRKYMGTFRTTFIVNSDGIIEKIFSPKEIKTKIHAEQILNQ